MKVASLPGLNVLATSVDGLPESDLSNVVLSSNTARLFTKAPELSLEWVFRELRLPPLS